MGIALKEASETEYWLELLHETGYLKPKEFASIMADCQEVLSLLAAIVKTTRKTTLNS
jgi:four helix bundle protein